MKKYLFKQNNLWSICIITVLAVAVYVFGAPSARAARFYFEKTVENIEIGSYFQLDVKMDTEGESINAIESRIVFPKNIFKFAGAQDGNSVINLWVAKPTAGDENIKGDLSFAGLTPGGVKTSAGKIISLRFYASSNGEARISFRDTKAYLNSQDAESASVKVSDLVLNISSARKKLPEEPAIQDSAPPETFGIYLSKSPGIYNGKWFISFATQDKNSGINRYEVKESLFGIWGGWIAGGSPYQLTRQSLFSIIRVRATDNAGNSVVVWLVPVRLYILWVLAAVLIILVTIVFVRRIILITSKEV
ncbi:MAG: Uncharacterized protein CEN90_708 [Parcubacteria group bacterium Licking1014_17]|nr:MAG: Uncharacterized protein CEN90_708 [Parcubacteria group bacterium Licking1014_17]